MENKPKLLIDSNVKKNTIEGAPTNNKTQKLNSSRLKTRKDNKTGHKFGKRPSNRNNLSVTNPPITNTNLIAIAN